MPVSSHQATDSKKNKFTIIVLESADPCLLERVEFKHTSLLNLWQDMSFMYIKKECCNPLHHLLVAVAHWDFELYSSSNHISPLLNRPQGCQGYQNNQKDLRITTMIHCCASFQPKLNELHKNLQNQQKLSKYAGFLVIF